MREGYIRPTLLPPPQVDFVKLLHDKLMSLSLQHAEMSDEWRFPRPSFKVGALLFIPRCPLFVRRRWGSEDRWQAAARVRLPATCEQARVVIRHVAWRP